VLRFRASYIEKIRKEKRIKKNDEKEKGSFSLSYKFKKL